MDSILNLKKTVKFLKKQKKNNFFENSNKKQKKVTKKLGFLKIKSIAQYVMSSTFCKNKVFAFLATIKKFKLKKYVTTF